jgi:branched-chain amino acid transport system permease protein
VRIWAVIVTAGLLVAFFAFDRFSRYGLAMRAAAADQEAAAAVGVPVRRVFTLTWAIAGGLAAVGGLFLAGFPNNPNPTLGDVALRAFPAIILGGLGSPAGAVVGGIVIGVVEVLTSGYAPAWLGANFSDIAPYVVMIAVLLVRPYGLFGTRPVERV